MDAGLRVRVGHVRPGDDAAAVAAVGRGGIQCGAAGDGDVGRLVHETAALPVAAYVDRAPAGGARGIQPAVSIQRDRVAFEADDAAPFGQAVRCQDAAVLDHAALQAVDRQSREDDQPAGGFDGLTVLHQRLNRGGFYLDAGQLLVGELQCVGFAGGQCHGAQLGDDDTLVSHLGRQQRDITAEAGLQFALVDDAAGRAVAVETVIACHEVGSGNAVRGGHQSADINARAGGEIDAVGVGEKNLPRSGDAAENLAGIDVQHAVQCDCVAGGLIEIDLGGAADIEGLPINGGTRAALVDVHHRAGLSDAGGTGHHLTAGGQLTGGWRGGKRSPWSGK